MAHTYIIALSIALLSALPSFAQEEDNIGTEVINVVKPYTPSVSDAFKVKETPVVNDSTDLQKKNVDYTIFSVPVASTFTPAKGKAASVEKQAPKKRYANYASLGLGNYLNVLAELQLTHALNNHADVQLGFNHQSTQGGLKDVQLDDKFYDTQVRLGYQKRSKEMTYQVNGIFNHQQYNWYGTSYPLTDAQRVDIDAAHTYLTGGLGGVVQIKKSVIKEVSANYLRFWDNQNAAENHMRIAPKFEFEIADHTIDLGVHADYLSGVFDIADSEAKYSNINFGLHPNYHYETGNLTLDLGLQAIVDLDDTHNETHLLVLPKIKASYPILNENIIAVAGLDGGIQDQSYYSFAQENRYLSPIIDVKNTHNILDGYLGFKGKVANMINYDTRLRYKKENQKAFLALNPVNDVDLVSENYQKPNTFGVVYDDVSSISFFGKVTAAIHKNQEIGVSATYTSFSLTTQEEAWNIPNLKATIFGNFALTDKISGGIEIFYVGERKDQLQSNTPLVAPALATLDDYMDVNLKVNYKVTQRFTAFLKGNNLASENYQRYISYPVQQVQILGGLQYKFDF